MEFEKIEEIKLVYQGLMMLFKTKPQHCWYAYQELGYNMLSTYLGEFVKK